MPRFFIDASAVTKEGDNTVIAIVGQDAVHITRVLRMHSGEPLVACDSNGTEYETRIRSVGETVLLDVLAEHPSRNEPPYRAVVYQALVKGDRFDTVLQKATELGASEIVPIVTSRCTVKLTPEEGRRKGERWQRIVAEAAKQCGRGVIPTVRLPMKLDDALLEAAEADLPLFCYEGEGTVPLSAIMGTVADPRSVAVVIGPEGGYSEEEAARAAASGMRMTGLGRRILRTETAAPFVLSCVSCQYEL